VRIAVITARGGSKRIPRKNLKEFLGRPLIGYSVQAAVDAGIFDRIIVSTEDSEIASVARDLGAETPFMRPNDLADDFTGTHAVMTHAVRSLMDTGCEVGEACCIYATAPFIRPEDILAGLAILQGGDWHSVFAATTFPAPIFRSFRQEESGGLAMIFPQHFQTRSQDLPETYHDAGQFYWARAESWLRPSEGFSRQATIVKLPRWRVQDIDTPEDWEHAELLWRFMHRGEERNASV
jgi:N-acylneuraminate cytidylyltransferase